MRERSTPAGSVDCKFAVSDAILSDTFWSRKRTYSERPPGYFFRRFSLNALSVSNCCNFFSFQASKSDRYCFKVAFAFASAAFSSGDRLRLLISPFPPLAMVPAGAGSRWSPSTPRRIFLSASDNSPLAGNRTLKWMNRDPVSKASPFTGKPSPATFLNSPSHTTWPGLLTRVRVRPLRCGTVNRNPHNASPSEIVFFMSKSQPPRWKIGCGF
mmetsp:Transcript_24579/g.36072  ORF Transcript_24579/g.36072 Transcript_24579/m.36072 type:complete len:213 (-) Transcript_24579:898-1536(-)